MVVAADRYLSQVWPSVWPFLERAVRRSKDALDVLGELRAERAQLWAVYDGGKPVGAVVTRVQDVDGEKRVLFWLVGGSRAREWGADMVAQVERWARDLGATALWGVGRRGWRQHMAALGFERIDDFDGQPAWRKGLA
jgi:hypothetical protein